MLGWIPSWLRRTFAALVVALVVWLVVIPQFGAARDAVDAVRGIDPVLTAIAAVLAGAAFVAQAEMTRRVLPRRERPTLLDMFRIEMVSAAVSHTVPGGTAAGTAFGFRLMTQAGVSRTAAAFAAGVRGIGSALVLNVLLWAALLAWIPLTGFSSRYALAAIIGVVVIGLAGVIGVALVRAPARTARALGRLLGRLPLLTDEKVTEAVDAIGQHVRRLLSDRALATRVVGLAAVHWLTQAGALWLLLHAFGWRAGVLSVLVAFGVVNVLAAVPVTPRGLGVVEAALIPMLVGFGSPAAVATLAVVAWRMLTFWAPIPLGALSYVSILVRQPDVGRDRRLRRRRATEDLAAARGPRVGSPGPRRSERREVLDFKET